MGSKAFLYKEKADSWEKAAKDANPDSSSQSTGASSAPADPQALFLQAAFEKKKQADMEKPNGTWGMLGGLFAKPSEDFSENQEKLQDLATKNAAQLEAIQNLRSELVKMQTMHKDQAYAAQQKMKALEDEKSLIEQKNTNLQ